MATKSSAFLTPSFHNLDHLRTFHPGRTKFEIAQYYWRRQELARFRLCKRHNCVFMMHLVGHKAREQIKIRKIQRLERHRYFL